MGVEGVLQLVVVADGVKLDEVSDCCVFSGGIRGFHMDGARGSTVPIVPTEVSIVLSFVLAEALQVIASQCSYSFFLFLRCSCVPAPYA